MKVLSADEEPQEEPGDTDLETDTEYTFSPDPQGKYCPMYDMKKWLMASTVCFSNPRSS